MDRTAGHHASREHSIPATSIQRYYEEWWEDPRDIRNPIFTRLTELVRTRIDRCDGRDALDLGSGKGRILSMLVAKGLRATAVEFSPTFAKELKRRFPSATVVCDDIREWQPDHGYDLITCIELTQVLSHADLLKLLRRLRPHSKRLLISVSNRLSVHGLWVRVRRFQAPFIITYKPSELIEILGASGFRVVSYSACGFLTPISLFRDFQGPIITAELAERLRKLDYCFPRFCHLFLVEAVPLLEAEG